MTLCLNRVTNIILMWMSMRRVCPICGKEFVARPYSVKRGYGKYCSRKCADIGRRRLRGYEKEVVEMYRSGLSLSSIARKFGVSEGTVRKLLMKQGIKIRSHSEAMFLRWKDKEPTRATLEELYLKRGLKPSEIADLFGITPEAVRAKLERHGLLERRRLNSSKVPGGVRRFLTETMLTNYILYHPEEFGYVKVYLADEKDFDLVCVRINGSIERVEIERSADEFLAHRHNPENVDRVICYWGTNKPIPVPVMFVDKRKFLEFAMRIMKIKEKLEQTT